MLQRIEALSAAIESLRDQVANVGAANGELARQVSALATVVDALARAELARANASNMNTQVTRAMSSDILHIKDRVDYVADNTAPLKKAQQ